MDYQQRGFIKKIKNNRFEIDYRKTGSILLNRLHIDFLLYEQAIFHGFLLDVGCGQKPYSLLYDAWVDKSLGVDLEECIHGTSYIDVIGSVDQLPFESGTFDTILCTNVLEHVQDIEKALVELARTIKNNGYLILSIPFLYPVHEGPNDYWRLTSHGIRARLAKVGFDVQKIYPWGGPLLLSTVWFNLFFSKILCFERFALGTYLLGIVQSVIYSIYKISMFKYLVRKQDAGINGIVSSGYFVVARRKEEVGDRQ